MRKADQIIPWYQSRHYYDAVTRLEPNTSDFYRLFLAPGLGHCYGGPGGYPDGTFDALVAWVEQGIAPQNLTARSQETDISTLLCPYPKRAVFKGASAQDYTEEDFVCVD
jgi:hypothetical protein